VLDIDSGLVVERMGVREPAAGGQVVPPGDLDLILVPGLAFDEHGRRLGRGGGHYDRFLAGLSSARVGVAFEVQLAPQVPAGPGDERVDAVATERRIIQTGAGRGGAPA
jgi:5-formyltetrahydrofolate cyclo-ligase